MSILDRFRGETRAIQSEGVRDPTAATQLLTYASPGVRQIPEWDADSAIREAYLSSVIVYAAVTARAKALASCSLRAVLPGKDIADHNPNAPLAKLLGPAPGGPNPNISARRLWANATTNYIVTGKFAWELEAPEGTSYATSNWAPVRIWPLIARVLDVLPSDGGMTLFKAFKYGRGDRKVILQPSQVFYTYNMSLNDSRQAGSALQALRYDILAEVMQSIYDAAFLRNDARPAGLIVHAAFEEASQRRAFEQQWDAQHRSVQNANRMAFAEFEGGDDKTVPFQFINLGLSQKDAQMLATQQAKVERISMGLGVPLSMLDASGRTFNNAGQEATNFWNNTVLWDIADFEDEINRNLAPRLGPEIAKFDTRHVEALKPQSRFTPVSVSDAVDRKLISAEEGRIEMGYGQMPPELKAALDAAAGSNMTEQAALATGLAALAAAEPDLIPWIAKILGLPAPPVIEKPDPPPTLQLPPGAITKPPVPVAALRSLMDAERDFAVEQAWSDAIRRLFARQRGSTLDRLKSREARWAKAEKRDAADIFDPVFQQQQTEDAIAPLLAVVGRGDVSDLAKRVTDETYEQIRAAVDGADDISAAIWSVFARHVPWSDPTDRALHADAVRSILHAIADGSLTTADLVE